MTQTDKTSLRQAVDAAPWSRFRQIEHNSMVYWQEKARRDERRYFLHLRAIAEVLDGLTNRNTKAELLEAIRKAQAIARGQQ